jgi:SEC-C motif domain protein
MPAMTAPAPCPCGHPLPYAACCGRWHDGPLQHQAPDAQALMRSRYSAFVLERADYLLATWHPSRRPSSVRFEPGVKWLGLELRQHRLLGDAQAEVEFVARQKAPGQPAVRLHERSQFVMQAGRWYYLQGDHL